jgi:NAD(P)H-dependent FMN reductase
MGVSVGAIGTAVAQQHLRNVLAYLDCPALGQPECFIQAKEGLFDLLIGAPESQEAATVSGSAVPTRPAHASRFLLTERIA